MTGFRFRLEPVLALRRHHETEVQQQLADSLRALEAERARLEAINRELGGNARRLADNQRPGALDLDALARHNAYLAALERQREAQATRVAEETRRVDADRDSLLQASKDRKALEKLREGLQEDYAREADRTASKAGDEAALVRYVWGER